MSHATAFTQDQFSVPLADNVVVPFFLVARGIPIIANSSITTRVVVPVPSGLTRFAVPLSNVAGSTCWVYTEAGTGVSTASIFLSAGDLPITHIGAESIIPASGNAIPLYGADFSYTFWPAVSGGVIIGQAGNQPISGSMAVFLPLYSIPSMVTGSRFA